MPSVPPVTMATRSRCRGKTAGETDQRQKRQREADRQSARASEPRHGRTWTGQGRRGAVRVVWFLMGSPQEPWEGGPVMSDYSLGRDTCNVSLDPREAVAGTDWNSSTATGRKVLSRRGCRVHNRGRESTTNVPRQHQAGRIWVGSVGFTVAQGRRRAADWGVTACH